MGAKKAIDFLRERQPRWPSSGFEAAALERANVARLINANTLGRFNVNTTSARRIQFGARVLF